MEEKLPSAIEVGMDFARCQACTSMRWVTPTALSYKEYVHCNHCGCGTLIDARSIRLADRPTLFFWYLWEMKELNGKYWWLNPLDAFHAIWNAATPVIENYNRNQEAPTGGGSI